MVICSFGCAVATAKYWRFDIQLEAAGAGWAAVIAAVMTLPAASTIDAPNAARNGAAHDALVEVAEDQRESTVAAAQFGPYGPVCRSNWRQNIVCLNRSDLLVRFYKMKIY